MGRVSKVWKCGGIIGTLNYSITIRTIRIVWTEYHYSVFIFGPFSYFQIPNIFGIWYSVKNKYLAQHWCRVWQIKPM